MNAFSSNFKPWSNGLASSSKSKTWVYLWLRLARPCVHLRWLVMTCDHFGRDQICTQVNASFLPFGHSTQVSSQVQLAATCDYLRVRLTRASRYTEIHCYVLKNLKNYLFSKDCKVASNGEGVQRKSVQHDYFSTLCQMHYSPFFVTLSLPSNSLNKKKKHWSEKKSAF